MNTKSSYRPTAARTSKPVKKLETFRHQVGSWMPAW